MYFKNHKPYNLWFYSNQWYCLINYMLIYNEIKMLKMKYIFLTHITFLQWLDILLSFILQHLLLFNLKIIHHFVGSFGVHPLAICYRNSSSSFHWKVIILLLLKCLLSTSIDWSCLNNLLITFQAKRWSQREREREREGERKRMFTLANKLS